MASESDPPGLAPLPLPLLLLSFPLDRFSAALALLSRPAAREARTSAEVIFLSGDEPSSPGALEAAAAAAEEEGPPRFRAFLRPPDHCRRSLRSSETASSTTSLLCLVRLGGEPGIFRSSSVGCAAAAERFRCWRRLLAGASSSEESSKDKSITALAIVVVTPSRQLKLFQPKTMHRFFRVVLSFFSNCQRARPL